MMNAYACCETAPTLTELLLARRGEANVPPKFLLYFVELQRRQFGPIVFENKVPFGVLLQIVAKNVVIAGRREQDQPVFT